MPDCGALRIGEDINDPYTPPLEMVNVPPWRSSIESVPSRAFFPSAPIAALHAREAQQVGVANHGHHQTSLTAHSDTNVVVVLVR